MSDLKVGGVDLGDIIKESLEAGLKDLVEGAKEDFDTFILAIQSDVIEAVMAQDEEVMDELKEQLKAVGELNRIRAVNESWEQAGNIMRTIGRVAMKVAPLFLV